MRVAVVMGSFDAFHNGHLDLIKYGLKLFDRLIIEIGVNPNKKNNWFSIDERKQMIKTVLKPYHDRIEVHSDDLCNISGLCEKYNAHFILRGIKAGRTLDEELRNQNFYKFILKETSNFDVEFVYKVTSDSDFRGSSIVKKFSNDKEMLKKLVPNELVECIYQRGLALEEKNGQ